MKRFLSLVSLLVLLAVLTGCKGEEPKAPEEKLVPVETIKVSKTDLAHNLSTTGEVIAGADVSVTPKVSGRVEQVMVRVGDTVRKGQVLFQLDGTDSQNAIAVSEAGLEQSEAGLEQAQQTLKDAQINFERNKALFDAQAISKASFEAAESQLANAEIGVKRAQAAVKQAQASLNTTKENYNNATVVSPINGVVAAVSVDPGEMVSQQVSPITVVQMDTTKVKVNVSENVVDSIKTGSQVPVTINALNQTVKGTVISVAPKADPATKAFAVEIQLPNTKGDIKPGMVARLNLSTGKSAAVLALPIDAVLEREGQHSVFTVEDGKAKEVSVKVGVTSGELTEIKSGLKEGQTVIVTGNRLVGEGQKVKVVKELGGASK